MKQLVHRESQFDLVFSEDAITRIVADVYEVKPKANFVMRSPEQMQSFFEKIGEQDSDKAKRDAINLELSKPLSFSGEYQLIDKIIDSTESGAGIDALTNASIEWLKANQPDNYQWMESAWDGLRSDFKPDDDIGGLFGDVAQIDANWALDCGEALDDVLWYIGAFDAAQHSPVENYSREMADDCRNLIKDALPDWWPVLHLRAAWWVKKLEGQHVRH